MNYLDTYKKLKNNEMNFHELRMFLINNKNSINDFIDVIIKQTENDKTILDKIINENQIIISCLDENKLNIIEQQIDINDDAFFKNISSVELINKYLLKRGVNYNSFHGITNNANITSEERRQLMDECIKKMFQSKSV